MPALGSYYFKPKHNAEVARKIIDCFADKFLDYEGNGIYLEWVTSSRRTKDRQAPPGYVQFYISCDHGGFEYFTETCYHDEPLTGEDLTSNLFALLGDNFWYEDDNGETLYSFEERDLCEIVHALAEDNTRIVSSFDGGTRMGVIDVRTDSKMHWRPIDTLPYLLEVDLADLDDSNDDKEKQLTLPLA